MSAGNKASDLEAFLATLPSSLSVAETGRRAMGFLLCKQYAGRPIPECASLKALMNPYPDQRRTLFYEDGMPN